MNTVTGLKILPLLGSMAEKLQIDKYKGKGTAEEMGRKLMIDIAKNTGKVENEVIQIVAILENKSQEEIRKQSFFKTLAAFKAVFDNEEFKTFF